jgi:hypothetical protein
MEKPLKIAISNGLTASAIRVQFPKDLSTAIGELELHSPRPVLVIVGGAGKMSEADLIRLRSLFVVEIPPYLKHSTVKVILLERTQKFLDTIIPTWDEVFEAITGTDKPQALEPKRQRTPLGQSESEL